jgi:hypothetical protein
MGDGRWEMGDGRWEIVGWQVGPEKGISNIEQGRFHAQVRNPGSFVIRTSLLAIGSSSALKDPAGRKKMPGMNGTRLSGNPVALAVGDFMELAAR